MLIREGIGGLLRIDMYEVLKLGHWQEELILPFLKFPFFLCNLFFCLVLGLISFGRKAWYNGIVERGRLVIQCTVGVFLLN